MSDQKKAVEQLWYTWSDEGLDTIRAGFRIRAASEGLMDIRSVRVKSLDRYQRYSLPRDVDLSTVPPSIAPICLSLIATGQERILVQKAYTGRDGVGRYGSFFIHLLAGLPKEFSAMDAISLWKSPFWQDSDVTLEDRQSTSLGRVSLADLKMMGRAISLNPQGAAKIQKYLPYVIQAYLTKRPHIEVKTAPIIPQKLYIAASDDDIAQLISGLTRCLPEQLLKDLTFSTYEHDVTEATTEIIGTCWLSVPAPEMDPLIEHLLPTQYYQEKLAINCYTGTRSRLENNPLVFNKPLAAQFAQDATEYFVLRSTKEFKEFEKLTELEKLKFIEKHQEFKKFKEFEDLLDTTKNSPNLDVDELLNLYESMIVRAENPSNSNLDSVLTPRSHSNFTYTAKMLSRPGYQRALINRAIHDPNWWWTFGRAAITKLREQSANVPMLAQAFSQIARRAIASAMDIARAGVLLAKATTQREGITDEEATFTIIVDLMFCAAPPDTDTEVWLLLLQELLTINGVFVFLNKYWNTQGYHPFIEDLLQQLSRDSQRWSTAGDLFDKLVAGKYGKKLRLLFILLDSAMGKYEDNAKRLLRTARLTAEEKAPVLQHYGQQYLPLPNKMSHLVLEMFGEFVRNDVHKEKMLVLFSWLESPLLSTWFDSPPMGEKNLEMVLNIAHLNMEESGEFFKHYGQKYISLYPRSSALLNLFKRFAESGAELRLYLLYIWLNPQSQLDQETLEQVLRAAHLTANERVLFLEHYGEYYISRYPQSQVLLSYVWEFLEYLWTADIDIFKRSSSPKEPSATERFLGFLCQSTLQLPSPQLICDWYIVGKFVREPSFLREQLEKVAASIGRLLRMQNVPQETHAKLINKLAVACIEDENGLMPVINTLHGVLTPSDLLLLLYEIAEIAGDDIRQGRYAKTLFVPCIQFAFSFKTVFYEEAKQEGFVRIFLDTLLLHTDQKTFNWLNTQAKKWPSGAYAEWQRYASQRPPTFAVVEPSRFERMKLWRKRTVAFTHMRMALRSKKIGRIVRVATDHIITLDTYHEKVPADWWWQIDAAFDFFIACEDADENTDESREQAIVAASRKIDNFVNSGLPTPMLTMHEKRRNESAKQYIAYLNTQRMKAAMLSLSTARMGQAMALTPNAVSAKKPQRGIFGWFKKLRKGA